MESSLDVVRPYAIRYPNWFHSVVHNGVFAIASIVIECVVQLPRGRIRTCEHGFSSYHAFADCWTQFQQSGYWHCTEPAPLVYSQGGSAISHRSPNVNFTKRETPEGLDISGSVALIF